MRTEDDVENKYKKLKEDVYKFFPLKKLYAYNYYTDLLKADFTYSVNHYSIYLTTKPFFITE